MEEEGMIKPWFRRMGILGTALAVASASALAGGGDGDNQDDSDPSDRVGEYCPAGDSGASVDRRFARWMLIHHEAAIQMAYEQLERGEDEELKKLAQQTIDAEEETIDQLRSWLEAHGGRRGFRDGYDGRDDKNDDRERRSER